MSALAWRPEWDPLALRHPPYRRHFESDPVAWAPILDEQLRLDAVGRVAVVPTGGIPVMPVSVIPPTNPHLALLAKVRACPHRGPKLGAGCNCLHRCGLGKGSFTPGEVSVTDCLRCVEAETVATNLSPPPERPAADRSPV